MLRATAFRALRQGNLTAQQLKTSMQNCQACCTLHTSAVTMLAQTTDYGKPQDSSHATKGVPATERIVVESPRGALPPLPPDNCCMSGCANCVWLKHAEDLLEHYKDGGEKAMEAINKIQDPTLKMFLKMELKALGR